LFRIDDVRQRVDGKEAAPLVPAIAGHRHEAGPVRSKWRHADRLIPDVALPVGPDHVLGRHAAVGTRIGEFRPGFRLIHSKTRQVRRAAGFEPSRPQRIRLVMRFVFQEDRPVPCVFQFGAHRRLALHRNRFGDDAHVFPCTAIPILIRIRRIRVVHVQVFRVGAEHGQSPRAEFVVPDRDARQYRLAAADDVPAWRDEVDPVPQ
jgi:hypothetical protein